MSLKLTGRFKIEKVNKLPTMPLFKHLEKGDFINAELVVESTGSRPSGGVYTSYIDVTCEQLEGSHRLTFNKFANVITDNFDVTQVPKP